jgi:hypothetical protein
VTREVVLLAQGDPRQAQRIFESFAERTGLVAEPVAGGVRYALDGTDREVKVIETLTDIDARWALHVALGQPRTAACGTSIHTSSGPARRWLLGLRG